jgi:hypothetical protein
LYNKNKAIDRFFDAAPLPDNRVSPGLHLFCYKLHVEFPLSHDNEHPFDLHAWIEKLSQANWIEEVYIFGSRRYLSSSSFGSDIYLSLAKMLFGANPFEISNIQEDETQARSWRSECSNVTLG